MSDVKVVVLISAKPGISHEFFKDHYENVHAPLALSLLPMIKGYRRNYFTRQDVLMRVGGELPDFDVITEMTFANRQDYQAFAARVAQPEVKAAILADEEKFIDSRKTRRLIVDERCSNIR